MEIMIEEFQARYIWRDLLKNGSTGLCNFNTDEQFDNDQFYTFYELGDTTYIKAYYTILDANAEMDTNDFCNWEEPDFLVAITGDDYPLSQ